MMSVNDKIVNGKFINLREFKQKYTYYFGAKSELQ